MKGGNIKSILDRFADENWEKEVTTLFVKEWIVETIGLDISTYRLGQYLSKHELFEFVKRLNKGRVYRVVNPLDNWMNALKGV